MATSLIRSRAAITGVKDRFTWNEIKDGAVLQEDGVIVVVGTYDDLHAKHPTVPVIGSGKSITPLRSFSSATASFNGRCTASGLSTASPNCSWSITKCCSASSLR